LLQVLNLILAPLPFVIVLMAALLDALDGRNSGGTPQGALLPAGFTFLIWMPIDLGLVAYGIWQALPANAERPLLLAIRPCTALALAGCTAWTALLLVDVPWLSLLVLVAMIWPLYCTLRTLGDESGSTVRTEAMLIGIPFGLFFGWQIASLPVSVTLGLHALGLLPPALTTVEGQIVLLALTLLVVLALTARTRNGGFVLAAVWTFAGVGVRQITMLYGSATVGWVAFGCALLVLLAAILLSAVQSARLSERRASA
jgi:hypothetical protein